jgi:4-hydroxy-2-oxoheptanedioate aldolase
LEEIVSRVRATGLGIGIHFPLHPELQIKWARRGLNIILHSSDLFLFQRSLAKDIATIRETLGD